ncbi:MAG: M14 family zinc carboxypeptidase, partial [Solirubrobacteraceae bacterium]
ACPDARARRLVVPVAGTLDARLGGAERGADWDLFLFDALAHRRLAASEGFGAAEVVTAPVVAGDIVVVQACRVGAPGPAPPLTVGESVADGPLPAPERQSLVSVHLPRRADARRLVALGFDLGEVVTGGRVDAVLHGRDDARRLRRLGYAFRVRVPDLAAQDRRGLRPFGARVAPRSALPSGRATYRILSDYEAELKQLVADHPTLVRPVVIGTSVEGRAIAGVEIARDVGRPDDGRPTHVELGLHHAREWSSGEVVMEFARTLATATDARARCLLAGERTFLFPVINPDGFAASQLSGTYDPAADDDPSATAGAVGSGQGAYRRKNCRVTTPNAPCAFQPGVDLNRNYAAFWGGPGNSDDPAQEDYRGPAPFSEPETQAVHRFSSTHQVMLVNSNHNFGGDVLYQPGFAASEPGLPAGTRLPYADRMVAVAREMASAAGYQAFVASNLYDVTGATEDENYFAQGAFGYTTEVGYDNFHPDYQDAVVDQYTGSVDGPLGREAGRRPSQGLRESMLRAGEAALDARNHAVIRGTAPAGRVLRLTEDFTTTTSRILTDTDGAATAGAPQLVPEHLESTLTVPADGTYVWHVNPSTRPLALVAGRTEAWTLTCGPERRRVVVGLGESRTEDLGCGARTRLRITGVSRRGRAVRVRLTVVNGPVTRVRVTLGGATVRRRGVRRSARLVLRPRTTSRTLRVSARAPSGRTLRAAVRAPGAR